MLSHHFCTALQLVSCRNTMKRGTLFSLLISFIQHPFLSQVAMLLILQHEESKIENVGISALVN